MSASNYDSTSKHGQNVFGTRFLDNVLQVRIGDRVLDFGCGTGNTTMDVAQRIGPSGFLLGVDPNEDRVTIATSRFRDDENVKIIRGSAEEAAAFAPYDVIFSNYVVHWIPADEHVNALRQIFELLKSGGKFGFTTLREDLPGYLYDVTASQYGNSYENFLSAIGWSYRSLVDWETLLSIQINS